VVVTILLAIGPRFIPGDTSPLLGERQAGLRQSPG
jgi:hypothetical protein